MTAHLLFGTIICFSFYKRGKNKKLFLIAFLLLYIFSAIRYEYGNDYNGYLRIFNQIKEGSWSFYEKEFLFVLWNKCFSNFYIYIAVTSIFFLFVIYLLIIKNIKDEYIWYALFIFLINPYIFLISLSAIRQTLATVLFIIALYFSRRRLFFPYIGMILLATFFHTSAFILLPVYFIANEKKVTYCQVLTFSFVLLFFVFCPGVFNDIVFFVLDLLQLENYKFHCSHGAQNTLRATLLTSLYFIYIAYNLPKMRGKSVMYSKIYFIGLSLGLLAYQQSMTTRLQMYFDVFAVMSIPMIMRFNQERHHTNVETIFEMIKGNQTDIKNLYEVMGQQLEEGKNDVLSRSVGFINAFAFPFLLFVIYGLRYYSFFTNPLWTAFYEYKTIFSLLIN